MVTHLDLFQTILDHAGIVIDDEERARRRYPGRSFRALCRGDAREQWPEQVFAELGLVRMVRTRDHKLVRRYPDGPNELFDLGRDPREARSFFNDPAYAEVQDDLNSRIEGFFAEYEDPRVSGLRVRELPKHSRFETWDWTSEVKSIETNADWLEQIRREWAAEVEDKPDPS
jgi:arylsulfatase A-like enzyme